MPLFRGMTSQDALTCTTRVGAFKQVSSVMALFSGSIKRAISIFSLVILGSLELVKLFCY